MPGVLSNHGTGRLHRSMKKTAWFLGAAIMGAVAIFGSGTISAYLNQNTNLVQIFFGFLGALGIVIGFI